MKGCGSACELAVDGDLPLVHRLEQRGLRLRRGAVDLVGQQEVGEDGARLEFERLGVGVVDGDAEDVAGQHVAGELQAVEAAVDGAGEGVGEGGLAHAGDVLDQQVAAREQADERQAHHLRLAADGDAECGFESLQLR